MLNKGGKSIMQSIPGKICANCQFRDSPEEGGDCRGMEIRYIKKLRKKLGLKKGEPLPVIVDGEEVAKRCPGFTRKEK